MKFCNGRGTTEQWIKEGKNAVKWTRLSCHDFVDNQVRLQLFALAYNLGNFLRRLALPRSVKHWSLTTLREKLIKIGAKVVTHSRYVIFQMAEVAVPQWLFRAILERRLLGSLLTVALAWTTSVGRAVEPSGDRRVVFLDSAPGLVNGSATYDPATRTCGRGSYEVFTDLDSAAKALADADDLYVRGGTYSRKSVGKYLEVHGNKVNYYTGALAVNAVGTPQRRKRVSAYESEVVVIQARPGISSYNPDPQDRTYRNSSHYYPHPAISISGAYLDVVGFKTYGQVVISGAHHVTLESCDLGGGGPCLNQGAVVMITGTHDSTIRSNRMQHSCWGENAGFTLQCYESSFIVENNEFLDAHSGDILLKDTKKQQGRTIAIRKNFFGPSTIKPSGTSGCRTMVQYAQVDNLHIHHNIFDRKSAGIAWESSALKETAAYNNTFVDCDVGITCWLKSRINAYNNLHFHSRPKQKFYDLQADPLTLLNSDGNLFWSTPQDTGWFNRGPRGATLAAWQAYSGNDANSVSRDPRFVNPSGGRPQDFKRKGDPKATRDVSGSKYGPVCGAYVTGDEIIGPIPNPSILPKPKSPPSDRPRGADRPEAPESAGDTRVRVAGPARHLTPPRMMV